MLIADFKKHFSGNSQYVHFNNSGQAPIPDVNRDLLCYWAKRFYTEGAFCSIEGWLKVEETRKKLAHFIGASPEEVAFFQTTASALSQIALSLPLKLDDEILTWEQEYPSNFYPWRIAAEKSAAKIIQIKSENWQTPVEKILQHVTNKTKVIALSWVQYQTGSVTDLKKLADELKTKNIWLVADVIQGVGVRPFNFHQSGFDVVCGGSHKWLCSSYGAAYMAIKKNRLADLAPIEVGAMTFGGPDTEKSFINHPITSAAKFEPGSKAMAEIIAMAQSLELFEQVGIENIFAEACRLADLLRFGLKQKGFNVFSPENSPIVNFAPQGAEASMRLNKIADKFKLEKISYAKRGAGIRLSLHAFNYDEEIEKVLKLI